MGGLNSGRFGRRSSSLLESDCIPVRISELRRAGIISSRADARIGATSHLPVEVELNGDDHQELRARLSIGTDTGQSSWIVPREGPHVPPAEWLSDTSLFVRLTTTRPTYGGARYWFVCPRRECARKCEVLYRPRGCNARAFACRQCHSIRYVSQRLSSGYRAERRAEKLLRRAIVGPDGWVQRPRGMHRRTYAALLSELEYHVERAWASQPLGHMLRGLDRSFRQTN